VASQNYDSACLVQAGGSLIFHCLALKELPEMSPKCSMASLTDDIAEQILLQSQSTFVNMWFDRLRVAQPPYDTLAKIEQALPPSLYQPGVLRTQTMTKPFCVCHLLVFIILASLLEKVSMHFLLTLCKVVACVSVCSSRTTLESAHSLTLESSIDSWSNTTGFSTQALVNLAAIFCCLKVDCDKPEATPNEVKQLCKQITAGANKAEVSLSSRVVLCLRTSPLLRTDAISEYTLIINY
jgi:hypothetical protein